MSGCIDLNGCHVYLKLAESSHELLFSRLLQVETQRVVVSIQQLYGQ